MSAASPPLPRGQRGLSVILLVVGSLPLLFAAVTSVAVAITFEVPAAGLAAFRLWCVLLYVAGALLIATLWIFCPPQLALFLPTPLESDGLFDASDPLRHGLVRAIPYVMGVAATAMGVRTYGLATLAAMLYTCAVFRAALPALVWLALRWRRTLLSWGGWLFAASAWVPFLAILSLGDGRVQFAVLPNPLLLGPTQPLACLAVGVVLLVLMKRIDVACRRASIPLMRRDELLAFAFPLVSEGADRHRPMFLDLLGGGPRRRRLVFLFQEATGLHRPRGAVVLLVGWLVAAGVQWLAIPAPASSAHALLGTLPAVMLLVVGLFIYVAVSHASWRQFPLPVGHGELFAMRAAAFGVLYIAIAVMPWALAAMRSGDESWQALVLVGGTNAAQLGLLLLTLGTGVSAAEVPARVGRRAGQPGPSRDAAAESGHRRRPWASMAACMLTTVLLLAMLLDAVTLVELERALWLPHAAHGLWMAFAAFAGVPAGGLGELRASIGFWRFEAAAWLLLALALVVAFAALRRRARGRAHPDYSGPPLGRPAARIRLFGPPSPAARAAQ